DANRTTESADWGNMALIFKEYSAKITYTYVRHSKRVNVVRWLKSFQKEKEIYFLSGSDDKLAILWNFENPNDIKSYELQGHESGVNAVDGLQRSNGEWLLATAAADSTLKLWSFHQDNAEVLCKQTLFLNSGFCFTLRLTLLPKSEQILLAFTADDESVALWAEKDKETEDSFKFQPVHKLMGHEDWVRGLDFVQEGEDLLLASSSQDNFIRLWRIASRTAEQVIHNKVDIFNLLDEATGEIRVEEKIIQLSADSCTPYAWNLSYMAMIIGCMPSEESGIWMEKVRLGEVGGNSLGFFGGKFSRDGKSILGHSYQGGFHLWKQSKENESIWLPHVFVGGHFGEVRDLAWEPQGEYLMSVSADQTTRIHAPWRHSEETWHELARPQVHGYDMQALALLSRYKFASGAEEKIVRTFQAPANFIENFRRITKPTSTEGGTVLLERLQFRPSSSVNNHFQLASCGDDYLVRIYQINL
ncbi:hypothetical protein DOY81_013402, partial [Sarcophaga bullata]